MNRIKTMLLNAKIKAITLAANKKAASLWEYLLVIALVCVVGGILLQVIGPGIRSLWTTLLSRLTDLVNTSA